MNIREKCSIPLAIAIIVCSSSVPGLAGTPTKPSVRATRQEPQIKDIIGKVQKALVMIVTEDKTGNAVAQGSGFYIGDGIFITNLHVFKWASAAKIKFIGADTYFSVLKIVAFDMIHDLCAFKLSSLPPDSAVGVLEIDPSPKVDIGDEVIVGGNPKGLEGTFSKGIVSGLRNGKEMFQIDAPISPGSSGGPVVNGQPKVIGVATSSVIDGQNLNFAVSTSFVAALEYKWMIRVSDFGALAITDREYNKLKGQPQSVKLLEGTFAFNDALRRIEEVAPDLMEEQYYDRKGNITKDIRHIGGASNPKGTQIVTHYDFGEKGLLQRYWTEIAATGHKTVDKVCDEADAITKQSSQHEYCSTNLGAVYDCKGNLLTMEVKQGDKTYRKTIQYDNQERMIQYSISISGEAGNKHHITYEDDSQGNWIVMNDDVIDSSSPKGYYRISSLLAVSCG